MKKKDICRMTMILCIALSFQLGLFCTTVYGAPGSNVTNTLTMEEDWRLTKSLDISAGTDATIIVDGLGKYRIYEMNSSANLINSTGTVLLKDVDLIWYGANPAAGSLAEIVQAATAVKTITPPAIDATSISLPSVTDCTVSIYSSSNTGVIHTDGVVIPPTNATTVQLVLAVAKAANHGIALTDSISVIVPAKTATSGGSGSIGGGGGGSITDAEDATGGTIPVNGKQEKPPVTTSVTVPIANNGSGNIQAALTQTVAADLLAKAKETEEAGQRSILEIKIETDAQAKSAEVVIPRSAFQQFATETDAEVKVNTGIGAVLFDSDAVDAISEFGQTGDISISVSVVDSTVLSQEDQVIVGDRPVYDFTVTAGAQTISSFGDGSVEVSLPYTPKEGEDPQAIVVYYYADDHTLQTVRGRYDAATGTVLFETTHFSKYIIGYHKVSFTDVAETDWYADAVSFLAAREITTGVAEGIFGGEQTLTRGQFLVLLMKAYGIEPAQTTNNNFTDAGNAYYTNYLAKAKESGITQGVGNNLFHPEDKITREDMLTLLYRTLNVISELPESTTTKTLTDFSDQSEVSAYAVEAVNAFLASGTIAGSNGELDPKGASTRAQMAQILYQLLSN